MGIFLSVSCLPLKGVGRSGQESMHECGCSHSEGARLKPKLSPRLCRWHGQCGLGLCRLGLPGFAGGSQAGGREGLGAGASCPAQAQDVQGWLWGPPGVSQPLPCSVPLPQEPVHGGRQQAAAPAGGLLHHLVPLLCCPEPPSGLLPPGGLQQHHPVPV